MKAIRSGLIIVFGMVLCALSLSARAETYTVDGDQRLDADSGDPTPAIVFVGEAEVERSGAASPWTFDFSSLPNVSIVDLGSRKLYCARTTDTDKQKIVLDLAGADLVGTNSLAVELYRNHHADDLDIIHVGNVEMGGIDARSAGANYRDGGTVRIGEVSARAGLVRLDYLYTSAGRDLGNGGAVVVYATNDVQIVDIHGQAGDMVTSGNRVRTSGDVTVAHRGRFRVRDIVTTAAHADGNAASIRLDGGDASGDMTVEGRLRASHGTRRANQVEIEIKNYRHVHIGGDIEGYINNTTGRATDVIATNNIAGDIQIDGEIDLENRNHPASHGFLRLHAVGTVTLAELNLAQTGLAELSSGGGTGMSVIQGALLGFDTASTHGTGSVEEPWATTQTTLRAPAGAMVQYSTLEGRNAYLGGYSYRLADLDGEAGEGGILAPKSDLPGIATAPPRDVVLPSATLVGVLTATGLSATVVSVHWGTEGDKGATATGWDDWHEWPAHEGDLLDEYAHTIPVETGKEYTYRYAAANDAGTAWGDAQFFITPWAGGVLTLKENRQLDGDNPFLTFEETDAPVRRSGEASPWTFDFSVLAPVPTVVDLSSRKLYCARTTDTDKQKIVLDFAGADLVGTNSLAVELYRNHHVDDLDIIHVGNVEMGGIDARSAGSNYRDGGTLRLGTETAPVNRVRLDYLRTDTSSDLGNGGAVVVYATNDVRIADIHGQAGDIVTSGNRNRTSGDVTIVHRGRFRVRDIVTTSAHLNGDAASIRLDGGDASGDMTVEGRLRASHGTRRANQIEIEIKNYRHVHIGGDIESWVEDNAGRAADVIAINNIAGDIQIDGEIDLENRNHPADHGFLRLHTAGTVTLAELNLAKVGLAELSSGGGRTTITGPIAGFNMDNRTGSGTLNDPYATDETRLRAPFGQRVFYTYAPGGLNDDLEGKVWQLRDLDGEKTGGVLMPEPAAGTVIRFR